jgi:hypothetical protein
MPAWLTAILSALGSALAKIVKDAIVLLGVKELGRLQQENASLEEQAKAVQKGHEVYHADPSQYPDRYLRD